MKLDTWVQAAFITTLLAIAALAVLTGCAHTSEELKAIQKACREPDHDKTDTRCDHTPRRAPDERLILYCERRSARRDDSKDCRYVRQSEIERILRQVGQSGGLP